MNIRILADSSANLRDPTVASVPLRVVTDEAEFVDTPALDVSAMLTHLQQNKGTSSTSCPSVGDWLHAMQGAEAVLCFTITSHLSGSYNAACAAAGEWSLQNPEGRVFVLDTQTTGPEMQLMVEQAQRLIAAGLSFDEVVKELRRYKRRTNLLFSLSSLNNFAKNGRVNPALAKAVGLLGLRIVGMARNGDLHPMHKPRGEQRAIAQLISCMHELGFAGGRVRISHTGNATGAETLGARILELFPDCDIKICQNGGLCSYYCETGGLLLGFECPEAQPA